MQRVFNIEYNEFSKKYDLVKCVWWCIAHQNNSLMKKILLIISLILLSMHSVFADGIEGEGPKQLHLGGLNIKSLLDGKKLTCIRPYYRRNFPLIRLGNIREMGGRPAGPFDVQFTIEGTGKVRELYLPNIEKDVAEMDGAVKAKQISGNVLAENQMEDLFLEVENPWIYEGPIEEYFPADSGILMNLKLGPSLTPREEEEKMKRTEAIRVKLEKIIEEQSLENKKAVELVDKRLYDMPSGFGNIVKNGHRKIILIMDQQEQDVVVVEEVLFVIESPTTYYEETVAWCAPRPVIDKYLTMGREVRNLKTDKK